MATFSYQKMCRSPAGDCSLREFVLDTEVLEGCIEWAEKKRRFVGMSLIERELSEMKEFFPYFIPTIARRNAITYCRSCGGLVVWSGHGLECMDCRTLYNIPAEPQLAFVGQIPSIVGEINKSGILIVDKTRPVFRKLYAQMKVNETVKRHFHISGKPDDTHTGKYFFMPTVRCYYPGNWPKNQPTITFEHEYFQVLGIAADHVFPATERGYALCIYQNWVQCTLRITLQQRIVPRIIIDLMLADLQALGKLRRVLDSLGVSLHEVYNWIGRPGLSEQFQREYSRYVYN